MNSRFHVKRQVSSEEKMVVWRVAMAGRGVMAMMNSERELFGITWTPGYSCLNALSSQLEQSCRGWSIRLEDRWVSTSVVVGFDSCIPALSYT